MYWSEMRQGAVAVRTTVASFDALVTVRWMPRADNCWEMDTCSFLHRHSHSHAHMATSQVRCTRTHKDKHTHTHRHMQRVPEGVLACLECAELRNGILSFGGVHIQQLGDESEVREGGLLAGLLRR